MLTRRLVLQTPPKSSHRSQLLSCQHAVRVSPLAATLMNLPASIANKRLTVEISPLDSALTQKQGRVKVNQPPDEGHSCRTTIGGEGPLSLSVPRGTGHPRTFLSYLVTSLLRCFPGVPRTPPATIFHPWLANASASISSPIYTGAKKSPAPFASLPIPPRLSPTMTNTAGSKSAQDTAK